MLFSSFLPRPIFGTVALAVCMAAGFTSSNLQAQVVRPRAIAPDTVSYLGVAIQEITADRAKELTLKEEAGVEVTRVEPESPAEKAGIKAADVLTDFNGQHVVGIEQFSRMVRETPAGRDVRLGIVRSGSAQSIVAKIGSRKANPAEGLMSMLPFNGQTPNNVMPDVPRSRMSWRSGALGIEAEALSGQLADFFGVKEGILIRSVVNGGPAEKAGLRAGDVIVKVGDSKVSTPADITSRMQGQSGRSTTVSVIRDKREMTVTINFESDRGATPRSRNEGDERF